MYNKEKFANELREKLIERNITQKELANRIGLTEATISRYMKGNRFPNIKTVYKINEALNYDFCGNNYDYESKRRLNNEDFNKLMKNKDFETLEKLIEIEKQIDSLENEKLKLLESI